MPSRRATDVPLSALLAKRPLRRSRVPIFCSWVDVQTAAISTKASFHGERFYFIYKGAECESKIKALLMEVGGPTSRTSHATARHHVPPPLSAARTLTCAIYRSNTALGRFLGD